MSIRAETGHFVHVVGAVDLESRTGEILYVNPVAQGMVESEEIESEVELDLRDADGGSLRRVAVEARRDACHLEDTLAMFEADVPYSSDLRTIALLFNGEEISRYEPPPLAATRAMAATTDALEAGGGAMRVSLGDREPLPSGLSYTIQASDNQGKTWTTLAVGCKSPRTDVNLAQFPGAQTVKLRVLETNGFEDRELLIRDVSLDE